MPRITRSGPTFINAPPQGTAGSFQAIGEMITQFNQAKKERHEADLIERFGAAQNKDDIAGIMQSLRDTRTKHKESGFLSQFLSSLNPLADYPGSSGVSSMVAQYMVRDAMAPDEKPTPVLDTAEFANLKALLDTLGPQRKRITDEITGVPFPGTEVEFNRLTGLMGGATDKMASMLGLRLGRQPTRGPTTVTPDDAEAMGGDGFYDPAVAIDAEATEEVIEKLKESPFAITEAIDAEAIPDPQTYGNYNPFATPFVEGDRFIGRPDPSLEEERHMWLRHRAGRNSSARQDLPTPQSGDPYLSLRPDAQQKEPLYFPASKPAPQGHPSGKLGFWSPLKRPPIFSSIRDWIPRVKRAAPKTLQSGPGGTFALSPDRGKLDAQKKEKIAKRVGAVVIEPTPDAIALDPLAKSTYEVITFRAAKELIRLGVITDVEQLALSPDLVASLTEAQRGELKTLVNKKLKSISDDARASQVNKKLKSIFDDARASQVLIPSEVPWRSRKID